MFSLTLPALVPFLAPTLVPALFCVPALVPALFFVPALVLVPAVARVLCAF